MRYRDGAWIGIWCGVVFGVMFLLGLSLVTFAQEKPPVLTDVQQLRLELHQAHVQIADLQLRLAQAQLAMERQAVTLDVLRDKPGYEIDWQTLTLKKVEPKPQPPEPPKKE